MELNIITNRPIINQTPSTVFSNANGDDEKEKGGGMKKLFGAFKKITGKKDESEMTDEEKRMAKELADKKTADKYAKKSGAVDEKKSRRDSRKEKRAGRRAKRTANKLVKINGRYIKPLSKVKRGKKKNPDGTTETVAPQDQVKAPNGDIYDKKDIASATGVAASSVTNQTLATMATTTVADPNGGGGTIGVPVPESNVVQTETGDFYAAGDTLPATNTSETSGSNESGSGDEKKPMSTTVKVLIGVGVAATIGAIIYVVAKGGKAPKAA